MSKTILVIGLTEEHAGKTSLATALLSYFSDQHYKTSGFKPFSGYNYWYHFNMAHQSLSRGRLYSKDIVKLQDYSTVETPIELVNPIHRLWNEPAIIDPLANIPPFIMDRFSINKKENVQHHLLINEHLIGQLPEYFQQNLNENDYSTHSVNTVSAMNEIIKSYYNKAIETCFHHIKKKANVIIVESYADNALLPWKNLRCFDEVFGIKPWEIHKYDPEKYVKAVRLSTPVSAWETSTKKLTDLLKPIKIYKQQPMLTNDIISALKQQIPQMLND